MKQPAIPPSDGCSVLIYGAVSADGATLDVCNLDREHCWRVDLQSGAIGRPDPLPEPPPAGDVFWGRHDLSEAKTSDGAIVAKIELAGDRARVTSKDRNGKQLAAFEATIGGKIPNIFFAGEKLIVGHGGEMNVGEAVATEPTEAQGVYDPRTGALIADLQNATFGGPPVVLPGSRVAFGYTDIVILDATGRVGARLGTDVLRLRDNAVTLFGGARLVAVDQRGRVMPISLDGKLERELLIPKFSACSK